MCNGSEELESQVVTSTRRAPYVQATNGSAALRGRFSLWVAGLAH